MRSSLVLAFLLCAEPARAADVVFESPGSEGDGVSRGTTPSRVYIRASTDTPGDVWLTLPRTCGNDGQQLTTDGTCRLSWTPAGGVAATPTPVLLDLGDDANNEVTTLVEIATVRDDYGAASEPSADKLVLDVGKLRPVQFGQVHFMGDATCGTATAYIGPSGTCNANEASVRFAVSGAIAVTGLACTQIVDTTCALVATVRDDGADTAATCTATNADTCNFAGSVAVAEDSLVALKLVDSGNTCTDGIRVQCVLTYTY